MSRKTKQKKEHFWSQKKETAISGTHTEKNDEVWFVII